MNKRTQKKRNAIDEIMRNKRLAENIGLDAKATDAFTNFAARMGHGTPSVAEGADYEMQRWSNNYMLMNTLYRNHWISRRIVDKPAQDMCKAWPVLQSGKLDPDDISMFDRVIRKTYTPLRIRVAIERARLYGGAGAVIVIDGHEAMLDKPLNLDDVNPGTYKGLIVFDRWSGITPSIETNSDLNNPQDYGLPEYYKVRGTDAEEFEIHSSRILRFCGPEVPPPENMANQLWGISELELAYEELKKRDNASFSILNLMFRAQIIGQRNPELGQLLNGMGGSAQAAAQFARVFQAQNELLSNNSMLMLGKDGELFSNAYSFGGIGEVYAQFQMDVAGAARIPVSILFGRTITGLGQSNDADIRIYEQDIAQKQNDEMRPQLDKLYPVIAMSEFGEIPDDIDMMFPSIRVLTEEQKAENAQKVVTAVLAPYQAGTTSQRVTLQELKATSDMTGMFTNITEEMIEAADDEATGPMELATLEAGDDPRDDNSDAEETPKKKSKANDSIVGKLISAFGGL